MRSHHRWLRTLAVACSCLAFAQTGYATVMVREANIVNLVGKSELILQGTVTQITDGIDKSGLPYTEVTLHVADAIRGNVGTTYTFRQFGLISPRKMGNGLVNVMVTPDGWPTYRKGEETLLFLNPHAKITGLQTTVGLKQGMFRFALGGATNHANNAGLFSRVAVDPALLTDAEKRVMSTQSGAVNARAFSSLLHRIVDNRWIEQGRMRDVR